MAFTICGPKNKVLKEKEMEVLKKLFLLIFQTIEHNWKIIFFKEKLRIRIGTMCVC